MKIMISRVLRSPLFLAASVALLVAGCSSTETGPKPGALKGERLPVLTFEQTLEVDPTLHDVPVLIPPPYANSDWPQAGGSPAKAMHHLALGNTLRVAWKRSIGDGESAGAKLLAAPIVADGRLYAMDTRSNVTALDAKTGAPRWRKWVGRKGLEKTMAFGGGVSFGDGKLFATSGYGIVVALDPATGNELWRHDFNIPLRGAPAVAAGKVYVVTQDNELYALSTEKGEQLWDANAIVETAGLLGVGAPAIAGDTMVVGFSSGELNALRTENGHAAWQDSLSRTGRLTALAALTDIDASPVIDRGRVFAIGHGGRMVALELNTGERAWEKSIAGLSTPWVAGDYLFIITTDSELICLTRREGRVRFITQLQRYEDVADKKGLVRWSGPVLAGDRLLATSSNGYIASLSPYSGKLLSVARLPSGSWLPPIVADATLYTLTSDGEVVAFR